MADRAAGLVMARAGDRAPDATGLATAEGERRLFDLTRGGHFTLLSFGGRPAVDAASPGAGQVTVKLADRVAAELVPT